MKDNSQKIINAIFITGIFIAGLCALTGFIVMLN